MSFFSLLFLLQNQWANSFCDSDVILSSVTAADIWPFSILLFEHALLLFSSFECLFLSFFSVFGVPGASSSSLSFVSLLYKSTILFLPDMLLLSTYNYSFSPNFLNFVLIYINYLKFSDYFCFFLTFSLTLSNLPFSISSIIRLPFTSNSIYLATTVPILPSFAFVFGIYSLLCTLTLYFFRISHTALFTTHIL